MALLQMWGFTMIISEKQILQLIMLAQNSLNFKGVNQSYKNGVIALLEQVEYQQSEQLREVKDGQ